jgi:hypothetical protein
MGDIKSNVLAGLGAFLALSGFVGFLSLAISPYNLMGAILYSCGGIALLTGNSRRMRQYLYHALPRSLHILLYETSLVDILRASSSVTGLLVAPFVISSLNNSEIDLALDQLPPDFDFIHRRGLVHAAQDVLNRTVSRNQSSEILVPEGNESAEGGVNAVDTSEVRFIQNEIGTTPVVFPAVEVGEGQVHSRDRVRNPRRRVQGSSGTSSDSLEAAMVNIVNIIIRRRLQELQSFLQSNLVYICSGGNLPEAVLWGLLASSLTFERFIGRRYSSLIGIQSIAKKTFVVVSCLLGVRHTDRIFFRLWLPNRDDMLLPYRHFQTAASSIYVLAVCLCLFISWKYKVVLASAGNSLRTFIHIALHRKFYGNR